MNTRTPSLSPRPMSESQSEMVQIVLPNDTNPLGTLLGGRLMHWIDIAGALAIHRHSLSHAVTASIDHMDFFVPVQVGDLVILRSTVNRVFRTSAEVGVKAWVEDYRAGTRNHVSSAYLTFVAVDENRRPILIPPVMPENEEQRYWYEKAGLRRELRMTRHPEKSGDRKIE